jgi:pimeloyl-ACP methyl ester carboxylesterase
VEDVMEMADVVEAGRFSVVGHDWGGAVAWALASRHPRRIRRLVSVSTPHPKAIGESIFFSLQLLRSSYILLFRTPVVAEAVVGRALEPMLRRSGLSEDKVEDYARHMRDPGALTAALRWYRAAWPGNVMGVGDITEVPTLYVWGSGDPALGRRAAERTAAHVKAPYRFVPIDGAPHWIPEERAEILNPLLLDHLRD